MVLLLLAVPALVVALAGCSAIPGLGGKDDVGQVTGDGSLIRVAPDQRGAPVDLTGRDLDGRTLDLASYRGRPVVVNVWGSWCGPCNKEAPLLVRAAKELAGTASFVGLTSRESGTSAPKSFVRQYALPYPSLFDPDGTDLLAFRGASAPTGTPTTLVLDGRGRYAAAFNGAVSSQTTLVELVRDIAAGR